MVELAVLTGDIVGSQKLEQGGLAHAFDGLAAAAAQIEASTGQNAHLTRTRGDGWQAVTLAQFALRAAFLFRAGVRQCGKAFETRLGVGLGTGRIYAPTLEDAEGPAFVASGHALDTMGKSQRITGNGLPPALQIALPLADRLSGIWTPRQAEVALHALGLPKPTQDEVGRRLGVSRQAIHQHWEAAHLDAIAESCAMSEIAPDESK